MFAAEQRIPEADILTYLNLSVDVSFQKLGRVLLEQELRGEVFSGGSIPKLLTGPSIRTAGVSEVARVCVRFHPDVGDWHRREYGDVQRDQCGVATAAAVPGSNNW